MTKNRNSELQEIRGELAQLRELLGKSRRDVLAAAAREDRETPDPTPVEMPLDYGGPPTLAELVNDAVARQLGMLTGISPPLDPDPEGEDWSEDDPEFLPFMPSELVELESELPPDPTPAEPSSSAPEGAEGASAPVQEPPSGGEQTEPAPGSPASQ